MLYESLIERMYRNSIILFGDFKLTSGMWSPYYIDLRKIYSIPYLFRDVVHLYRIKLGELSRYDVISGIETGSIPLASVLAYTLEKPMIYVRKRRKEFGASKIIEGVLNKDDYVIVIEDVVTTGGSVSEAVDAIKSLGGKVEYALAFIDRMQGASRNLSEKGVKLISIYRVTDMLNYLFKKGFVDKERYLHVLRYIKR